jgi:hypothetical protein
MTPLRGGIPKFQKSVFRDSIPRFMKFARFFPQDPFISSPKSRFFDSVQKAHRTTHPYVLGGASELATLPPLRLSHR